MLTQLDPRRSIRSRVAYSFIFQIFVLTAILSYLINNQSKSQIQEDRGVSLSQTAFQTVDKLDRGLFSRYTNLYILRSLEIIQNPEISADEKRIPLEDLKDVFVYYAWLGFVDLNGQVQVGTEHHLEGTDASQEVWFINGKQGDYLQIPREISALTTLLNLPATENPPRYLTIAVPVYALDEQVVGVLAAHINWQWAEDIKETLLETANWGAIDEVIFTDEQGLILLGDSPGHRLDLASIENAQNGKIGYRMEEWQGESRIVGYAQSQGYLDYEGAGWIILVQQNTETAFAPAYTLQHKIISAGIVLSLLFALLTWFIAERITRPLTAITASANQIEQGNMGVEIPYLGNQDEIGILARSLKNLVETLQRQRMDALRRLGMLVENSPDGIIGLDMKGNISAWNLGAEKIYGYSAIEILHQPIMPLISPEDLSTLPHLRQQLLEGQSVAQIEATHIRRDKTPIDVAISASLVSDDKKNPQEISVVVRDISARKQAERQLEQVVRDLSTLHELDRELGYTLNIGDVLKSSLENAQHYAAAHACCIGWIKEENRYLTRLDSLGDCNYLQQAIPLIQLLEREDTLGKVFNEKLTYGYASEALITDIFISLLVDTQPLGVLILEGVNREHLSQLNLAFLVNLADRTARSLNSAYLFGRIQASEEIKTQMINMASHDLKNPLGQVIGYVDMLEYDLEAAVDAQQKEFFVAIKSACTRMEHILEDILNLEKLESEGEGTWASVNLIDLVHKAVDFLRPQAELKKQTLATEIASTPAQLMGSETYLIEVFVNLINNAIKYTPEAGRITVRASIGPSRLFHFEVEDTGYGIPLEKQSRIFERFYRAKASQTSHIAGTGLGLSLVKAIIEKHGGDVWFRSEEGVGSTFGFDLQLP